MQVSATTLGKNYGLTGQEMNRAMQKLGLLIKTADEYDYADKIKKYVVEKGHHRGPGGYSCYNADWVTRTYDDSIKDILEITPELIKEVKAELALERAARYAAQAAARAKANADFIAKQASEKAAQEAEKLAELATEEMIAKLKKAGIIGIVVGGGVAVGYGVYKAVPKVREWWHNRKSIDKETVLNTTEMCRESTDRENLNT